MPSRPGSSRLRGPGEKENVVSQEQMDTIHKESLCTAVRLLRLRVQLDGGGPGLPRPGRAGEGDALRRDARPGDRGAAAVVLGGARDLGLHVCYFCQERCPKGVDLRDAIAKLGAEAMSAGSTRDMGAKHAKWFVTSAKTTGWLWWTGARPEDAGRREVAEGGEVRDGPPPARQGAAPPPFPPHVAKDVDEARASTTS